MTAYILSQASGPWMEILPLIIATILREQGITGVHTHIQQLRQYLKENGMAATLITSFSWGQPLSHPVFALRPLVLERCSGPASVAWYRYWHEAFLGQALRRCLAGLGDCVVYAQDPLAARAALRARRGTAPARGAGGSLPDLPGR